MQENDLLILPKSVALSGMSPSPCVRAPRKKANLDVQLVVVITEARRHLHPIFIMCSPRSLQHHFATRKACILCLKNYSFLHTP